MMKSIARSRVIASYYNHTYSVVWAKNNILGIFERYMEFLSPKNSSFILELGGGSNVGHIRYVKNMPSKKYIILDIVLPNKIEQNRIKNLYPKIEFKKGIAEKIPYSKNYFDHVKITCVLHHVSDIFKAVQEIRRVTKHEGEIIILVPTDPGFLNLLVKKIITFRRINKASEFPAELIYALDHQNSIHNVLAVINYVFLKDSISIKRLPFFVKSVNFNLMYVFKIVINKDLD